ncbi:sulfatase family protein [Aestuariivivens sediminicola]|uniref:sulfatase family protein n=1 Tax=Aestuariivivens sediminicola TaxID=2913560 RepID=UPI001F56B815|nr:sulfatase [Aestuariivivens sediminicola]
MDIITKYRFRLLIISFAVLTSCKQNPAEQKRPNILFAISDDQSFPHTSFAGCNFVNTPAFDRVATEGVYFSNCYAGSPGCAPSRSSLVTGRYHWQNEQSGQHASSWMKKYVPFVDLLVANGYVTGLTGKGVGPFRYARSEKDTLWRTMNAAGQTHSSISYTDATDERFAKGIRTTNYFENFKYFMENLKGDKPFFFWYGAFEPHRSYEKGSWKRMGKKLEDVTEVPGFLPDNDEIRSDLLDYAVEIEWFDLHLQRMLNYLDRIGELDNTIVIVTSDNGMPFPRAKANCYEYGVHVPLAVRYPKAFPGKRVVNDPVSFIDIAPTILELTETSSEGMMPISGKSILNILKSEKQGRVDKTKEFVLAGRERHSSSRYLNQGYPQRVIRSGDFIYIWNIKPERWPAGAPQRFNPEDSTSLWPMFGLNEEGKYVRSGSFTDIDDSPTKTYIIENFEDAEISRYFELAHGKRTETELYNVNEDPYCLKNLAGTAEYASIEKDLKGKMMAELQRTKDPRVVGSDKEVFDSYIRYSPMRKFPKPEHSE